MATDFFRAGAIKCYLPTKENNVTVPSLATLTYAASAFAWDENLNRDVRSDLDTTATYQVILCLRGLDATNKGYATAVGSPGSGLINVTSGQGILITVGTSAWPANANYASAVEVWLKKNSGNFQLHSLYPVDTVNNWATLITTECTVDAITETSTTLQTTATDSILKNRSPKGISFGLAVGITEDGVTVEDTAEQIAYRPDTSTNYNLAVTRGMTVSFSILNNNQEEIVKARAGEYRKFTTGGFTFEISNMVYQAATTVATGNVPFRMIYPVDEHKAFEEVWMYGFLQENQTGGTQNWGKQNPPKVDYRFETINQDGTLQNVHAVVRKIRYASS